MITITKERLRERASEKVKGLEFAVTQSAFADTRAELEEELELARIALASLTAEPVAWTSEETLAEVFCDETGMIGPQHMVGNVPLYRHAQPAPVVQCPFPCGWENLKKHAIQDAAFISRGLVEGEVVTEALRKAAIANNELLLKVIAIFRAAPAQGDKK